jgi:hypothetical protein
LGRGQIDGWEIDRHAREIDPEFPVVYMSGDSAEAWASKGVPNSIMLAKPFVGVGRTWSPRSWRGTKDHP